jgi:large subunit ribosomal protein L15
VRQNDLRPPAGATHPRKRVGRGNASGHGTYSTKGIKGQKARSGKDVRIGFEGGQLPLIRRAHRKRGFTNIFKTEYDPVNVSQLQRFEAGSLVTPEVLRASGLVKRNKPIKLLGSGEIDRALTVRIDAISASARAKIEAAGGRVEEVSGGTRDATTG